MNVPIDELDIERIGSYLKAHVEGFQGALVATKFSDGQSNPTFLVQANNNKYVLRRQPPGQLLKSAHAVDREYQVMKALYATDVPVPKVLHLCTDTEVIGSMFYLMEYCDGRVLWDAALPGFNVSDRRAMYDDMNHTLAAIHQVDLEAAGLDKFGKPGNYFERQYQRWLDQYRLSELEKLPSMESLINWLEEHLPEDDGRVALVHGDYRLDNLMLHGTKPKIIATLDWELSTLGHPFSDLAYQCMQMRLPASGKTKGLFGVDRNKLGIPTEEEYVAQYCDRMGIDKIENWPFYIAFSVFRLAAILQGIAKRASQGNASNDTAVQMGAFVGPLAQYATDVVIHEK